MTVTTKQLSVKAQRQMHYSLEICNLYKDVDVLDVLDYPEAMDFLEKWAEDVKVGLASHLYQPHMMKSWLDCMSNFLHALTHFVDSRELILMVLECMPRLLEVLEHYTKHEDIKTRHEVCSHVVSIMRTMADRMDYGVYCEDFNIRPHTLREDEGKVYAKQDWRYPNDAQYQPYDEDTRVLADKLLQAYLVELKNDEEAWRVAFNNPVFDDSDYDDDFGGSVRKVKNVLLWVEAGMFVTTLTCGPTRCPCPQCCERHGNTVEWAYAQ